MKKIKKLINSIVNGNASDVKKQLNTSIAKRAIETLKEKKKEIAASMFQPKKKVKKLNENVLVDIQNIVNDESGAQIKLSNDEIVDVDVSTANALLTVFNALEDENKERMIEVMSSGTQSFMKIVDFAKKQLES